MMYVMCISLTREVQGVGGADEGRSIQGSCPHKILTACPRVIITFMVTYNALSVFNYDKLINNVYKLKNTYASTDRTAL